MEGMNDKNMMRERERKYERDCKRVFERAKIRRTNNDKLTHIYGIHNYFESYVLCTCVHGKHGE